MVCAMRHQINARGHLGSRDQIRKSNTENILTYSTWNKFSRFIAFKILGLLVYLVYIL